MTLQKPLHFSQTKPHVTQGLPWHPLPSPAICLDVPSANLSLHLLPHLTHLSHTGLTLSSSDAIYFMTPSLSSPVRIYSFLFSTSIASFIAMYQCFLPNYIVSLWQHSFICYLIPGLAFHRNTINIKPMTMNYPLYFSIGFNIHNLLCNSGSFYHTHFTMDETDTQKI